MRKRIEDVALALVALAAVAGASIIIAAALALVVVADGAAHPTKYRTVTATAYAPGCGDSGRTATGTRPGWGTIAVDPRYIRLGTRLYVPGYGRGRALDTGGAIKGWKIDLWFSTCSAALKWGRRTVRIRIG